MFLNEKISKIEKSKHYFRDLEVRVLNVLNNFGWTEENTLEQKIVNKEPQRNCEDQECVTFIPGSHSIKLNHIDFERIFRKYEFSNDQKTKSKYFEEIQFFDREYKLKVYDYVIEKTGKFTEPELSLISDKSNSKSDFQQRTFAEALAFQRNMKRRKLKYKIGKNPPLSIKEELKNLIEVQMSALEQYQKQASKYEISDNGNSDIIQNKNHLTNSSKATSVFEGHKRRSSKIKTKSNTKKKFKKQRKKDKKKKKKQKKEYFSG